MLCTSHVEHKRRLTCRSNAMELWTESVIRCAQTVLEILSLRFFFSFYFVSLPKQKTATCLCAVTSSIRISKRRHRPEQTNDDDEAFHLFASNVRCFQNVRAKNKPNKTENEKPTRWSTTNVHSFHSEIGFCALTSVCVRSVCVDLCVSWMENSVDVSFQFVFVHDCEHNSLD